MLEGNQAGRPGGWKAIRLEGLEAWRLESEQAGD